MTSLQMPKVENLLSLTKIRLFLISVKLLREENILSHIDEIKPYETDALAAYKQTPLAVVFQKQLKKLVQC